MSDNNTYYSNSSQIMGLNVSDFLLVLSGIGGLIALIFQNIRSSRCTRINCCGFECLRNAPIDDEKQDVKPEIIGNNNVFKFQPPIQQQPIQQIKNDNKI